MWFPDPWHKNRHHKRRLIQPDFVALVASRLAPGGVLHLATDWQDYATHMLAVLDACPALRNTAAGRAATPRARRGAAKPVSNVEVAGSGTASGTSCMSRELNREA